MTQTTKTKAKTCAYCDSGNFVVNRRVTVPGGAIGSIGRKVSSYLCGDCLENTYFKIGDKTNIGYKTMRGAV